jgi:hypothetical protein
VLADCVKWDIHDEKHVVFSCLSAEHLRHQFNYLFKLFMMVISKVLFFKQLRCQR